MKPISFPEHNRVYAKDQPEYMPLPVHKTKDGIVTSCWSLNAPHEARRDSGVALHAVVGHSGSGSE